MKEFKKILLVASGTLCVILGVLGMFLPLLPTTVFLLLAAYCYSHSSEKFHDWLMANRWCGAYIRNYKAGKGISLRQKATTILMLWASIIFSIWLIAGGFWVNLLMITIASGVTLHLVLLKTLRPEAEYDKEQRELTSFEEVS